MLGIASLLASSVSTCRKRAPRTAATLLTVGVCLAVPQTLYAAGSTVDDKAAPADENSRPKAAPDAVTLALKAAVRNGSISEERALQTYYVLTSGTPDSNTNAKSAYVERAAAKLDAMVSAGKLSADDADVKMAALERGIAAKQDLASRFEQELADRIETVGQSPFEAYLDLAASRLDEIVMTGELSTADAEAALDAVEKRIIFESDPHADTEIEEKADVAALLDQAAAKIAAMVESGEMSAEDAEAKLSAIKSRLAGEQATDDSLDARTVLRAAKRVDLNLDQKDEIRNIERAALTASRKISRKDKRGRTELAKLVQAEITALLNREQVEQFESTLKRLDPATRRAERRQRRPRDVQRDQKPPKP